MYELDRLIESVILENKRLEEDMQYEDYYYSIVIDEEVVW